MNDTIVKRPRICLTVNDRKRLTAVLAVANRMGTIDSDTSFRLKQHMEAAKLLQPRHYPADAVSIDSRVRFMDEIAGTTHEYALVFPGQANVSGGKISILSPVGSALLGHTVGERVHCRTPRGRGTLRILSLEYQPEASGLS